MGMPLSRREFLQCMGMATASVVIPTSGDKPVFGASRTSGTRTNAVIVLCNDLGYGDMACYGHEQAVYCDNVTQIDHVEAGSLCDKPVNGTDIAANAIRPCRRERTRKSPPR